MEKTIELRVKNRLESNQEFGRRQARDLLTEKDPVKYNRILNNWTQGIAERVLSKYQ